MKRKWLATVNPVTEGSYHRSLNISVMIEIIMNAISINMLDYPVMPTVILYHPVKKTQNQ